LAASLAVVAGAAATGFFGCLKHNNNVSRHAHTPSFLPTQSRKEMDPSTSHPSRYSVTIAKQSRQTSPCKLNNSRTRTLSSACQLGSLPQWQCNSGKAVSAQGCVRTAHAYSAVASTVIYGALYAAPTLPALLSTWLTPHLLHELHSS
jgi:hypothetical protein